MRFHKEGYTSLAIVVLFFFVLSAFAHYYDASAFVKGLIYCVSGLLLLFVLFFFRSPSRVIMLDSSQVYSPVDGTIHQIEEINLIGSGEERRVKLSIVVSPLNIRSTKAPISGKGRLINASQTTSSSHAVGQQGNGLSIKNKEGAEVTLWQHGGIFAGPVFYDKGEKEEIQQGQELGSVKFG
ncbi:MAG: phosphatidylserine decarboxylase, partial [Sphingobacterium hotanense]